jgi:hypothetical protein
VCSLLSVKHSTEEKLTRSRALDTKVLGIDICNNTVDIWDDGTVKFSATSIVSAGPAVLSVLFAPVKTAN